MSPNKILSKLLFFRWYGTDPPHHKTTCRNKLRSSSRFCCPGVQQSPASTAGCGRAGAAGSLSLCGTLRVRDRSVTWQPLFTRRGSERKTCATPVLPQLHQALGLINSSDGRGGTGRERPLCARGRRGPSARPSARRQRPHSQHGATRPRSASAPGPSPPRVPPNLPRPPQRRGGRAALGANRSRADPRGKEGRRSRSRRALQPGPRPLSAPPWPTCQQQRGQRAPAARPGPRAAPHRRPFLRLLLQLLQLLPPPHPPPAAASPRGRSILPPRPARLQAARRPRGACREEPHTAPGPAAILRGGGAARGQLGVPMWCQRSLAYIKVPIAVLLVSAVCVGFVFCFLFFKRSAALHLAECWGGSRRPFPGLWCEWSSLLRSAAGSQSEAFVEGCSRFATSGLVIPGWTGLCVLSGIAAGSWLLFVLQPKRNDSVHIFGGSKGMTASHRGSKRPCVGAARFSFLCCIGSVVPVVKLHTKVEQCLVLCNI